MAPEQFLRPWSSLAYRHIPADSAFGVLDLRFAGTATNSRWSYQGAPTLYLASDRAVALAEFARHLREDRTPQLARGLVERELFRLRVTVPAVIDLRESALAEALSLNGAPHCFLDRQVARSTGEFLRRTSDAQGLLVPSMAFLDQSDRWVLVLFLDKLPRETGLFISAVERVGTFRADL